MLRRGRDLSIAGDYQRLGGPSPDIVSLLAGLPDIEPFKAGLLRMKSGVSPVRNLPHDLALVPD